MENAAKNIFIAGLRNAHSMEIQARELMERQSESLEDHANTNSGSVCLRQSRTASMDGVR